MRWVILFILCCWHPAQANPLDAFGFGARSVAMGGAVTAQVSDVSANYYNPSGLTDAHRLRLDLGYALVSPELTMNGQNQGVDTSRGMQGGVIMPTTIGGRYLAFSIAVHLPDERVSRIRALPQRQPRWVLWDNRPQRLVITSSAAVDITEGLSVGAGLTFLANTAGTVHMTGTVDLLDADKTHLSNAVDVNLSAVRYVTAGATYRHRSGWSLGAVYRHDFVLRLDLAIDVQGDVVVDGNPVVPNASFFVRSINQNLYSPAQAVLALGYSRPTWQVGAELGWVGWSRFPTPTAEIELDLALQPLEVDLPIPAAPVPPHFRDIWVPRIGGEVLAWTTDAFDVLVRAGYFFEPSPVPDQPGDTNYIDSQKHGLSSGLALQWGPGDIVKGPLTLNVAIQHIHLTQRKVEKINPADPVGDFTAAGKSWGGFLDLGIEF